MHAFSTAVLSFVALLLTGCASSYQFNVDAIRSAPAHSSCVSYRLQSAHPDLAVNDAAFERAAQYVRTALSSKGMFEAPTGAEPDLIIEIDFGLDKERTEYWLVGGMPRVRGVYAGRLRSNRAPIGSGPMSDSVMEVSIFEKFVRITAREPAPRTGERTPREVWSVYVTAEDNGEDLSEHLPLLVAAAMDAIDSDTKGPTRIVFRPGDERVAFVMAGL